MVPHITKNEQLKISLSETFNGSAKCYGATRTIETSPNILNKKEENKENYSEQLVYGCITFYAVTKMISIETDKFCFAIIDDIMKRVVIQMMI